MKPIYLDYHATTPVAPEVLEAMLPWFSESFGNPSSRSHAFGWQANEAVDIARKQVAEALGVEPAEVFFTSGSTEGLNTLIKGLASERTGHVVTVSTEHPAVLDPIDWLSRQGNEVSHLQVDRNGLIDLNQLSDAIQENTLMVVVMWANNETGVIQEMKSIGEICRKKGIPLISDATQAFGKIDINPVLSQVDMLTVSAHKLYGPKGVGAIYINKDLKLKPKPFLHGGGHENGTRSGTLNVPGIVGLGKAAELSSANLSTRSSEIRSLRDHLEGLLLNELEAVTINGHRDQRLQTVVNISVVGVDSQAVMSRFRSKLAISSGSACSSANPKPSHVLLAMGLSPAEARSSFRFSLGIPTTREEIDHAAQLFVEAVKMERELSPIWQMRQKGIDLN